jgi:hypothetical protein
MRPVRSVALVGNGPLTEAQRQRIAAADLVIRLNKMNNRRAWHPRTKTAEGSAHRGLACQSMRSTSACPPDLEKTMPNTHHIVYQALMLAGHGTRFCGERLDVRLLHLRLPCSPTGSEGVHDTTK